MRPGRVSRARGIRGGARRPPALPDRRSGSPPGRERLGSDAADLLEVVPAGWGAALLPLAEQRGEARGTEPGQEPQPLRRVGRQVHREGGDEGGGDAVPIARRPATRRPATRRPAASAPATLVPAPPVSATWRPATPIGGTAFEHGCEEAGGRGEEQQPIEGAARGKCSRRGGLKRGGTQRGGTQRGGPRRQCARRRWRDGGEWLGSESAEEVHPLCTHEGRRGHARSLQAGGGGGPSPTPASTRGLPLLGA